MELNTNLNGLIILQFNYFLQQHSAFELANWMKEFYENYVDKLKGVDDIECLF